MRFLGEKKKFNLSVPPKYGLAEGFKFKIYTSGRHIS